MAMTMQMNVVFLKSKAYRLFVKRSEYMLWVTSVSPMSGPLLLTWIKTSVHGQSRPGQDESNKDVSCYVSEVTFAPHLRRGVVCQGNQPSLEGWNFQFYLPDSGGRGGSGGCIYHQWPMI